MEGELNKVSVIAVLYVLDKFASVSIENDGILSEAVGFRGLNVLNFGDVGIGEGSRFP